ncbi:hypothetical protein UT300019_06810 [Clostridium sp. CTA-19]
MSEQFYTILTKVGKAKIANATALGTKVNFCKFQVGDSNGAYYNPTEEQTELKHKVWQGNINNIRIDDKNPNWVIIEVILPSEIGGFTIREAAILDDEDNVIAVAKYPETYKPQTKDGSSKDILIRTILEVSNANSITLRVDPTVILATKKDIEVLEQKIKNIKVPVTSVNTKTGDIVLKAEDINCEDDKSVESHLDEMTKEIENIDLSANKVKLNKITGMNATDVQSGMQELFQYADNGKKSISNIIGTPLSATDTFPSMQSKIQTLKSNLASNLNIKKVSASSTESLHDLISKVFNIEMKSFATGYSSSYKIYQFEVSLSFEPTNIIAVCGCSSGWFAASTFIKKEEGISKSVISPTIAIEGSRFATFADYGWGNKEMYWVAWN